MNHERPKIVYIELMKCLRSIEGILNFTISKLSADFAALSASLFPCRPIWSSGPHEPTLYWNPVKRSFAFQGGCYPWHGAPFNVPSDRHWFWRSCQFIFYISKLSPFWEGRCPSFDQIWIPLTQRYFVPYLVEIGLVVLEKKMKMWKVYRRRTICDQKGSL